MKIYGGSLKITNPLKYKEKKEKPQKNKSKDKRKLTMMLKTNLNKLNNRRLKKSNKIELKENKFSKTYAIMKNLL